MLGLNQEEFHIVNYEFPISKSVQACQKLLTLDVGSKSGRVSHVDYEFPISKSVQACQKLLTLDVGSQSGRVSHC